MQNRLVLRLCLSGALRPASSSGDFREHNVSRPSWELHKKVCKAPRSTLQLSEPPSALDGVRLHGGINRPFYPSAITVPLEHPVWTMRAISPVSQIVGVPLLIHRELQETPLTVPNDANLDNQAVTYLMISPETGLAAPRYVYNCYVTLNGAIQVLFG